MLLSILAEWHKGRDQQHLSSQLKQGVSSVPMSWKTSFKLKLIYYLSKRIKLFQPSAQLLSVQIYAQHKQHSEQYWQKSITAAVFSVNADMASR